MRALHSGGNVPLVLDQLEVFNPIILTVEILSRVIEHLHLV